MLAARRWILSKKWTKLRPMEELERFVPGLEGRIWYEQRHRYRREGLHRGATPARDVTRERERRT
jgi:hypothetical protein